MVTSHSEATIVLDQCIELFNRRKSYLLQKNKTNWSELNLKELEQEKCFQDVPVGPVVIVVDELAELSKKATEKSAKSELQEKIATLARLARFTGIHLVLGTQRPDKSTLDMQSKDNLPTRVCFSVPSVTASTLVIGDMTASTLGAHPGRAVFQLSGNQIIQAPFIKNSEIETLMENHHQKTSQNDNKRKLVSFGDDIKSQKPRVVLK
jgi:S-DNA-T family DNA segregation ATPase FtsK/SpoIIIE